MTSPSRRPWPPLISWLWLTGCAPAASAPPPPPPRPAPAAAPAARAAAPAAASTGTCLVDGLDAPFVSPDDPSWGSPTAPVTIVIFDEFEHVFARRLERSLERLRARYGADRLRIVWKNNPLDFHLRSRPAAVVGQAVLERQGPEAFWRYRDALLRVGPDSSEVRLDLADIERAAAGAGLDQDEVTRALSHPALQAKIDADLALGRALGVTGTPTSFVNGHEVGGAVGAEKFEAIIDRELASSFGVASLDGLSCRLTRHTLSTRPPPGEQAASKKEPPAPEDTAIWKIPVGSSPARGPASAPVTIVEFGGYHDPFSHRVEPTLQKLREHYGDRLRIVWKDYPLPFQALSSPAAELTREIRARRGLDAFWTAHDQLLGQDLDEARLAAVAADAGLDAATAQQVIKGHKHERAIEEDLDLGDDFKATGTPHFFINGRRLVGASSFEKFRSVIDEQLRRADELLAQGKPAAGLYEALVASGKSPEPPARLEVDPPPASALVRGDPRARVLIQEFSSFQDPFSQRVEPTLQQLLASYRGRLKLVWREFPLPHFADAPLAGEAAAEAGAQKGADGFWKMHDLLLAHMKDDGGLKRPALEGYARQIGLDLPRFQQALDDHRHAPALAAEKEVAVRARIASNPYFVINGYVVSGAQSTRAFRRVIERALADLNAPARPR